jgi:hypothetical protein
MPESSVRVTEEPFAEALVVETAHAVDAAESEPLLPELAAAELYGPVPAPARLVDQTVEVVTAYLSHNSIDHSAVPALITGVHAALQELTNAPVQYAPKDYGSDLETSDQGGSEDQSSAPAGLARKGSSRKRAAQPNDQGGAEVGAATSHLRGRSSAGSKGRSGAA